MNRNELKAYMSELGRKGGKKTSKRKKEQCRINGLKNSPKYKAGSEGSSQLKRNEKI